MEQSTLIAESTSQVLLYTQHVFRYEAKERHERGGKDMRAETDWPSIEALS